MQQFTKKVRALFSEIGPRDLIYPGIVFFFFVIVGVLFFLVTQFITKSINDAFLDETKSTAVSLNVPNYNLVAHKLKIPITGQKSISNIPSAPLSAATEKTITGSPSQNPDLKALTINILNSTPKKGVAGTLAQSLESIGYAKAVTGNEKKLYTTTTILIKGDKASYGPAILEEIKKVYPDAILTAAPTTSSFDVTVIIGTN